MTNKCFSKIVLFRVVSEWQRESSSIWKFNTVSCMWPKTLILKRVKKLDYYFKNNKIFSEFLIDVLISLENK